MITNAGNTAKNMIDKTVEKTLVVIDQNNDSKIVAVITDSVVDKVKIGAGNRGRW